MEFVAIDFETANQGRDSAIAIGMTLMDEEGEKKDEYYSLIRPPRPFFDPFCTAVHHLKPEEVLKAPYLSELWSEIEDFIGGRPLVAHNAAFDMAVLKGSAYANEIKLPNYEYYCTLCIARRILPGLSSYRLSALADEVLQLEYNAHVASDDAYVCGKLFSRLFKGHMHDNEQFEYFLAQQRINYPKLLF